MKQCLIIAGGDFDRKFASSYISIKYHNAGPDCLIAADRGLQAVHALGLIPDIILGDYDSVDKACLAMYADNPDIRNLQYPPEKNYTDSQLAVIAALDAGATDICMMGMSGTRMDHVQANIGLLKCCIDAGVQAEFVDAHNRIRMIKHSLSIRREEQFGTYVSLVPYSDYVGGITISGFRYPLENAVFSKEVYQNPLDDMGPSRGISNEIVADNAEVNVQSGYLLVMESRD